MVFHAARYGRATECSADLAHRLQPCFDDVQWVREARRDRACGGAGGAVDERREPATGRQQTTCDNAAQACRASRSTQRAPWERTDVHAAGTARQIAPNATDTEQRTCLCHVCSCVRAAAPKRGARALEFGVGSRAGDGECGGSGGLNGAQGEGEAGVRRGGLSVRGGRLREAEETFLERLVRREVSAQISQRSAALAAAHRLPDAEEPTKPSRRQQPARVATGCDSVARDGRLVCCAAALAAAQLLRTAQSAGRSSRALCRSCSPNR
jgi:hypothetical protein